MDSKIVEGVHEHIHNLNQLLREAGVNEICDILESILQSPDEIVALYNAFASRFQRLPKKQANDPAISERRVWFRNFSSNDGARLGEKEINTLSGITSHWELSDERVKALVACSVFWTNKPELFWHGDIPDEDLIRRCYNDLRRMEDVDPLRRRVVLMILAEHVEQEQDLLRREGKRERARPRKRKTDSGRQRKRVLLPSAIRSLTKELWPQLEAGKQESVKKKLTTDSLYGWKWRQFARMEMVLSLQDATTKKFERYSWSSIEIEAINRFMETLPQYKIRLHLHKAMSSITSYYSGHSILNRPRFDNTNGHTQTSSEPIAAMTPRSPSLGNTEETTEQRRSEGYISRAAHSAYSQRSPCSQLSGDERSLDHSNNRELSSEDAKAAEVLSTLHYNSVLSQSRVRLEAGEVHQAFPVEPNHNSVNEEQTGSPIGSSSGRQLQLPPPEEYSEPQSVLNPLPPFSESFLEFPVDWGQAYSRLEQSFSRLDGQVEDWSTSFPENNPESHVPQIDFLPESVSNPLPPIGNIPTFSPLEWEPSTNLMLLENSTIVDSLSNPLPAFDSRTEKLSEE